MRFQRIVQLVLFGCFIFLLWRATYPLPGWVPVDLFVRLDPFVSVSTMIAARTWIGAPAWGFAVLGVSLVVGRFFCGYVCPLGSTIDFSDRFICRPAGRAFRNAGPSQLKSCRWKYLVLVALLCAAVLGVSYTFLLSPLALVTRSYVLVVYPVLLQLGRLGLALTDALSALPGFGWLRYAQIDQVHFGTAFLSMLLFLGILLLGRIQSRFWCRTICPAGALMALFSRRPLLRRNVDAKCTQCGLCIRKCPMGAIKEDPTVTAHGECIVCLKCRDLCPEGAIDFSRPSKPEKSVSLDLGRRRVLAAGASGIAAGLLAIVELDSVHGESSIRIDRRSTLIRPPGAVPEEEFVRRCIGCGECMKVCPTNTLQPVLLEAGVDGLWSPKTHARYAGCEQGCNLCGQVCPTGAIRFLSLEEKKYAKIGSAYIDRSRCIAWEEDRKCLICDEICPYDAIVMRGVRANTNSVPYVNESRCNGCGYCEQKCPVLGNAAIRVSPHGEVRLSSGSYQSHARTYGLVFHAEEGMKEEFVPDEMPEEKQDKGGRSLPPGFIID